MKGLDHLVIAGPDLEALRTRYAALGFTLTPRASHPFGTANSLVQLDGSFLELLTVAEPARIVAHAPRRFSFGAFNRDFLTLGAGASMLVLDSRDARADVAAFRESGIGDFEPFDFSRKAALPGGGEATVGFSLAFARLASAPLAGFFTCEQKAPEHFWKPEYQRHANSARALAEVALVAEDPAALRSFCESFTGITAETLESGFHIGTARGVLSVLTPAGYFARFRMPPPALRHGPRLAACVIAVSDMAAVSRAAAAAGLALLGLNGRYVVPAEAAGGLTLAFTSQATP